MITEKVTQAYKAETEAAIAFILVLRIIHVCNINYFVSGNTVLAQHMEIAMYDEYHYNSMSYLSENYANIIESQNNFCILFEFVNKKLP